MVTIIGSKGGDSFSSFLNTVSTQSSATQIIHETDCGPVGATAHPACRNCGHSLEPFLDHGEQPIANGFVAPVWDQDGTSYSLPQPPKFRVRAGFCSHCFLVQLCEIAPPEQLFHGEYPFLTSSSAAMVEHYQRMANTILGRYQPSSIVEIGINDGTLLQHFRHIAHLGFEPSANVAAMAQAKGLNVWACPFNLETACEAAAHWRELAPSTVSGLRHADVIVATHVVTHIPDLADFFRAVDVLLAPRGVLILEDPSLDSIVTAGVPDQLYEEHVFYLSLPAISNVLSKYGLEVIDVSFHPVHGGSLHIVCGRKGYHEVQHTVNERMHFERYLTYPHTFRNFAVEAEKRILHLGELVRSLRKSGKTVAAYGATSKSTCMFTRCGFTPDDISYISDSSPTKQGKFQPGTNIPIISREEAGRRGLPDVFVLAAWNHEKEIVAKERDYLQTGGSFVTWVPDVHMITGENLR